MLQDGIGNAEFNCAANFRLSIFWLAIVVAGEKAVTGTTFATVELDAAQAVGVKAYANGALGEAGFKQDANT